MEKYSIRTTRGRRVMTRQTPGGRRYTFFSGQWLRFNTSIPGHKEDIDYFKSDDLYEVVPGFRSNDEILEEPVETIVSPAIEEPKKMKARK